MVLMTSLFVNSFSYDVRLEDTSLRLTAEEEWTQFNSFTERFNKHYNSVEEFGNRFEVFRENFRNIVRHNLYPTQNFTMGVNQFTDFTNAEIKLAYVGGDKHLHTFDCDSLAVQTEFHLNFRILLSMWKMQTGTALSGCPMIWLVELFCWARLLVHLDDEPWDSLANHLVSGFDHRQIFNELAMRGCKIGPAHDAPL